MMLLKCSFLSRYADAPQEAGKNPVLCVVVSPLLTAIQRRERVAYGLC